MRNELLVLLLPLLLLLLLCLVSTKLANSADSHLLQAQCWLARLWCQPDSSRQGGLHGQRGQFGDLCESTSAYCCNQWCCQCVCLWFKIKHHSGIHRHWLHWRHVGC